MNRLVISNLVKKYGSNVVLDGLSFFVKEGEIYGLIGVNGAGKTTTLESIEGLCTYNSGKIELNYVETSELSKMMGIQLQITSFPPNYKVIEMIKIISNYKKSKTIYDIVERLRLNDILNKKMGSLSLGQKRRLAIGLAIINNPQIIIFDEPTAGLDPVAKRDLHEILIDMRNKGATILLTSHDMSEIEKIADRIGVLKQGKIYNEATAMELTAVNNENVCIQVRTKKKVNGFEKVKCQYIRNNNASYVEIITNNIDVTLWTLLQELKEKEDCIEDLKINRDSLEEYLVNLSDKE